MVIDVGDYPQLTTTDDELSVWKGKERKELWWSMRVTEKKC